MKNALQYFRRLSQEIENHIGDTNVYLYGSSLRDVLLGKAPSNFSIFIESKNIPDILLEKLKSFPKFDFKFGRRISLDECFYTVDCVYALIDDIIAGNDNVFSTQNALKDLNKKILRFSKSAKSAIMNNPFIILETVLLVDRLGFYLDSNTINVIFNNKKELNKLEKRKIFNFLKEAIKSKKPRKIISNLNTLSLSVELFGMNLVENSVLNHLKENDFYEFITMIFSNVEYKDMENFLVDKCGFLFRDTPPVLRLAQALDSIQGQDEVSARNFLSFIDKKRLPNTCRLLKALDFKDLSKNIKKEKKSVVNTRNLCITEETIMNVFGITDEVEVKLMLDKALKKIINEPEYNNQAKLLVYLNRERNTLWQEEEKLN